MSAPILVAYATRYGSTQEVAEAIAATLRDAGLAVELHPVGDVRSLEGYSAVVLGAALYAYHWHKDALRFLSRHRKALLERPVAIFTLGPVHDPHDDEEWQNSREQLEKEMAKFPWLKPIAVELFGGQFEPSKFRFPVNVLAGAEPASDIRDWAAIRDWARELTTWFEPADHSAEAYT